MATIPSIAMIPSGVKASKLYSVLPTDGTGDFTTTRASVATRVNENGLIEEVASNVPRLDYSDGGCPSLLLENSATNLIAYSESFSNWSQDGTTTLDNNIISPDGTLNASKITFNSGNERVFTSVNTTNGSFSAYFKGVQGKKVRFRDDSSTIFNEITLTENWVRHYLYKGTANANIQIQNVDATDVYVWGAQAEENSYATSYIKNAGTALGVTRVADTATSSGSSTVINSTEGVLYAQIGSLIGDESVGQLSISDGTNNEAVKILYLNANEVRLEMKTASGENFVKDITVTRDGTFDKVAIRYKSNDYAVYHNGIAQTVVQRADVSSGLNVLAFNQGGASSPFNGKVKSLQVYTTALSGIEIEKLTSYTSFNAMANALNYTII